MITTATTPRLFELGQILTTPGALSAIYDANFGTTSLLNRHKTGDWGDIEPVDKRANDRAVRQGTRILSAYQLNEETRIWIITEADRSATTILLPEEY